MTVVEITGFLLFTRDPFSRGGNWNQRGYVTRSRSQGWDQTQESEPGFKPRHVWLQSLVPGFPLSSFYSGKEGNITGLSSPSAIQGQGLLISACLGSQVPISGKENLIGQINCTFLEVQPARSRGSRGCRGTTESGGQLLGKTKNVGAGRPSQGGHDSDE